MVMYVVRELTEQKQPEKHAALGTKTREESSPWVPTEMTLLNRMNMVLDIFLPATPPQEASPTGADLSNRLQRSQQHPGSPRMFKSLKDVQDLEEMFSDPQ